MSDNQKGLYDKYTVINNETQKPIDGPAFILRPDRDPYAIAALQRYAELTVNEILAQDITGWIEVMELMGSDMPPKCDYCESVAKVKSSPFMADAGASMCKQCWDATRKEYIDSHSEDIGDF